MKRRRRQQPSGGPSIFFIIALAVGLALLLWFFVNALRHPVKQEPPRKTTSMECGGVATALKAAASPPHSK